ncbi:hypothetical protein [Kitasatospora indigofera]|uniref:hypothetical protein n=1 Tax=Kitasatospora indigofera TaxID=67307 RepID=UPI0033A2AEFB
MDGSEGTAGPGSGDESELCDACGALVPAGELALLRVPDSSAVAEDARLDGERHLARLAVQYQRRPFRAVCRLGPLDRADVGTDELHLVGDWRTVAPDQGGILQAKCSL